jgi:hypothetical protein
MRVPPVFDPAQRDEELVCDGAVICSFPYAYLELIGLDPTKSLGMCFDEPKSTTLLSASETKVAGNVECMDPLRPLETRDSVRHYAGPTTDLELIDWVHMLASTAGRVLERFQRAAVPDWLWEWNVLSIEIQNSLAVQLKISPTRANELFALGEKSARAFFVKRLLASGLLQTAVGSLGSPAIFEHPNEDFPPPKLKMD